MTALVDRQTLAPVRHRSGRFVYQELSSANGSTHLLVQTFKVALRLTTFALSAVPFEISDYSRSVGKTPLKISCDFLRFLMAETC
jgi:hypothetical protein